MGHAISQNFTGNFLFETLQQSLETVCTVQRAREEAEAKQTETADKEQTEPGSEPGQSNTKVQFLKHLSQSCSSESRSRDLSVTAVNPEAI